jgi:hypothetical protein
VDPLVHTLVHGRPTGLPLRDHIGPIRHGEERVQGDPRGPGVRPTKYFELSAG